MSENFWIWVGVVVLLLVVLYQSEFWKKKKPSVSRPKKQGQEEKPKKRSPRHNNGGQKQDNQNGPVADTQIEIKRRGKATQVVVGHIVPNPRPPRRTHRRR